MTKHRWHKEIKAWADGIQIQERFIPDDDIWIDLQAEDYPFWHSSDYEYRIKPQPKEPTHVVQFTDEQLEQIQKAIKYASDNPITQPKEPQYLYVYLDDVLELSMIPLDNDDLEYIGKIKLEVEDE